MIANDDTGKILFSKFLQSAISNLQYDNIMVLTENQNI